MIEDEEIQSLIDVVVERGGYIKNLHGQKNVYYQINATYYSALGENDRKMLLARALQLFMPGKPQVWYLDLLAGKNDHEAVRRAGEGGHKEINRTNILPAQLEAELTRPVVQGQLALLRMRKRSAAFAPDAQIAVNAKGQTIVFTWKASGQTATLAANLADASFTAEITSDASGEVLDHFVQ